MLTERRVGRFPMPLHDRIPNFAGAEEAARRLTDLPEWQAARRIKCNPDAPQRAVRLAALRQGKTVVMAVPRLRAERCFLRLDPRELQVVDDTIPMTAHDVPLDVVVTPDRVIRTHRRRRKPAGIFWEALSDEQLAEMPALAKLARTRARPPRRRA